MKKTKTINTEIISSDSESAQTDSDSDLDLSSNSRQVVRQTSVEWEGPLPPPKALAEFDQIVGDGAERIMKVWEGEVVHRQKFENRNLNSLIIENFLGKTLAFLFSICVLLLCWYAIEKGYPWIALILGGGTVGVVVWGLSRRNTKN